MLIVAHHWWSFVLRGVLAIIFGLVAFLMPGITLLALIWVFAFYATLDGVINIAAAFRRGPQQSQQQQPQQPWWALLIQGILGLLAAALAIVLPGLTALALIYLIAAWAIVTGVTAVIAAIRLRNEIRGEWLLVLSGVLSVVFGVLAVIFPGAGALALVFWIGAYATVFGVLLIVLGFKVRSWLHRHVEPTFSAHPGAVPS
jgi:uncharacterized membrane protein HdeD (DUF308 family)